MIQPRNSARVAALCLMAVGVADVHAQNERAGTSAAPYLLVPVTARQASLASTMSSGLENGNGIEQLSINPAALSTDASTSALFSRLDYVGGIGVNTLGLAQRVGGRNFIALNVTSWDIGDIPLTTESQPDPTDVTYSAGNLVVGATFARQLTDRIAAGVTSKVVNERISDMSATAVAFDAGMTYIVGESGVRFGVSVNNIGTAMKYGGTGLIRTVRLPGQNSSASVNAVAIEADDAELPTNLNFGASYRRPLGDMLSATVLTNFRSNTFDQDQYSGAVELAFRDIARVSGGYEVIPDTDMNDFNGLSLGAGLNLPLGSTRLSVDYAYRQMRTLGNLQFITLGVNL